MKKYFNILSVFLIVLVCFLTLTGCKSAVKVKDDGGDMLIQTTEERGIHLSRRNAINDDGSFTLQALVMPADATNKKLTWSLKCDDENFWDAYDLENYVKLTVSSDTLSCNVLKLGSCPVQLKIVVTSQVDSSISATCTVDFYKLTNSLNLDFEVYSRYIDDPDLIEEYFHTCDPNENNNFNLDFISSTDFFDFDAFISTISSTSNYGVGTINCNTSYTVKLKLHDDVITDFEAFNFNEYTTEFVDISDFLDPTFSEVVTLRNLLSDLCSIENADCLTCIKRTSNLFTLEVIAKDMYANEIINQYSSLYTLSFNLNDVIITSIDLDESNIIL